MFRLICRLLYSQVCELYDICFSFSLPSLSHPSIFSVFFVHLCVVSAHWFLMQLHFQLLLGVTWASRLKQLMMTLLTN
jgi:hypothetical protein